MKRRYALPVVLLCLCAGAVPIVAVERARDDVTRAALCWVRKVSAGRRPGVGIGKVIRVPADGIAHAYVIQLKGGGFCICAADDLLSPVILYCPQGEYDPRRDDCRCVLDLVRRKIDALVGWSRTRMAADDPYREDLLARRALWDALREGRVPTVKVARTAVTGTPSTMALPLTSTWRQGVSEPGFATFNRDCPELTNGSDERCIVGCTATAMAQIMYYWRWPNAAAGSSSTTYEERFSVDWESRDCDHAVTIPNDYPWIVDGQVRLEWVAGSPGQLRMQGEWDESLYLEAQGLDTDSAYQTALQQLWNQDMVQNTRSIQVTYGDTYAWEDMVDHWTNTAAAAAAMARVSYHAAVGVETSFGVEGSSSTLVRTRNALEDHFHYQTACNWLNGVNPDNLREEVQWLRPLMLRGANPGGGGHMWIVYGYDSNSGEFLMNLGWGGNDDGWYVHDAMPPDLDFNDGQETLRRIAPENVKFVGGVAGGTGTAASPYKDVEVAVQNADDHDTLIFQAGSENTFSDDILRFDRPFTLKGKGVSIQQQ